MRKPIKSHTELQVYQKAFGASMEIFRHSQSFPKEERYSLTDQVRRSSRSVCSNLAEAWRKRRYSAAFVAKLNDAEAEAARGHAGEGRALGPPPGCAVGDDVGAEVAHEHGGGISGDNVGPEVAPRSPQQSPSAERVSKWLRQGAVAVGRDAGVGARKRACGARMPAGAGALSPSRLAMLERRTHTVSLRRAS